MSEQSMDDVLTGDTVTKPRWTIGTWTNVSKWLPKWWLTCTACSEAGWYLPFEKCGWCGKEATLLIIGRAWWRAVPRGIRRE